MAHADSVQAGLVMKVREVEVDTEAEGIKSRKLELRRRIWEFYAKFERFSEVGQNRLEEVEEERNRWKEEKRRVWLKAQPLTSRL